MIKNKSKKEIVEAIASFFENKESVKNNMQAVNKALLDKKFFMLNPDEIKKEVIIQLSTNDTINKEEMAKAMDLFFLVVRDYSVRQIVELLNDKGT